MASWQELPLDRIYFDSVTGVPGTTWPIGTPTVPSDVIADVILMCAARNLKVIDVHGALTLGAAMAHYSFVGHRHEDVADTFDLNGQDLDSSIISKCIVTGAQGATGFLTLENCLVYLLTNFQGIANHCDLYGSAMSLRTASFADLQNCNSVHSDLTITVNAPTRASFKTMAGNCTFTAQTGGVLYIRGYKGTLVIDAMTGGTCDIYANGADITLNANCTGGTINIYGNARVTDNSGATVVNDYTKETQLDTIEGAVGGAGSVAGKPNVQDTVIYPVAEDAATDEIVDDGASPAFYPAAAHSTDANTEGAPGFAWLEDIDFEQDGTINLISIYAELEWQTKVTVGGGDATNSISKIQISRDGGTNWVDITDNFINPAVVMTNRRRFGVGLWVTTIVAGVDQLQFRLCHWTDDTVGGGGRSTSEAQIRCNSYVRLTYRKS